MTSEIDILQTLGVVAGGGGGGALLRWVVLEWAKVRREAIVADREDNTRMVEALIAQAASNATLCEKLDGLSSKLDAIGTQVWDSVSGVHNAPPLTDSQRRVRGLDQRERDRVRTEPLGVRVAQSPRESQGVRIARRGSHHDEG